MVHLPVVPSAAISTMTTPKQCDLLQLKLRKRLLAQQLAVLDSRVDRVTRVLQEKRMTEHSSHDPLPSQGNQCDRRGLRRRAPFGSAATAAAAASGMKRFVPPAPYIKQLNTAAPVSHEILHRRQQQLLEVSAMTVSTMAPYVPPAHLHGNNLDGSRAGEGGTPRLKAGMDGSG